MLLIYYSDQLINCLELHSCSASTSIHNQCHEFVVKQMCSVLVLSFHGNSSFEQTEKKLVHLKTFIFVNLSFLFPVFSNNNTCKKYGIIVWDISCFSGDYEIKYLFKVVISVLCHVLRFCLFPEFSNHVRSLLICRKVKSIIFDEAFHLLQIDSLH